MLIGFEVGIVFCLKLLIAMILLYYMLVPLILLLYIEHIEFRYKLFYEQIGSAFFMCTHLFFFFLIGLLSLFFFSVNLHLISAR